MSSALNGTGITFSDGTSQSTAGAVSKASNGYQKLPSGLYIQWGTANLPANTTPTVTFPTSFPSGCVAAYLTVYQNNTADIFTMKIASLAASSMVLRSTDGTTCDVFWLAIGY